MALAVPRQGDLLGDGLQPDRFRVRQPLGRGATGQVLLAWDNLHQRDVALKLLHLPGAERQAALHEARALARIRHPNVVTVFEMVQHHDPPFLVMDYIEGETLQQRLDRADEPLSPALALSVGRAVASALVAAHQAGVIHRDIKPSNVMLGHDGSVTLIDFGVASCAAHRAEPRPGGDATGLVGTPLYLAPELLQGDPPRASANPATDQYALGALLYRMLAGRPPHPAATLAELRASLARGPAPELGQLRGELPAPLTALVQRCLAPVPTERFSSAGALLQQLEQLALAASRPLPAAPYVGLAPLTAREAGVFFGREAEVAGILGRLRNEPVVTLVGASGAGKSSLALAGVTPRVLEGELDSRRPWALLHMSPGRRPLESLARAMAPLAHQSPEALQQQLLRAPQHAWRLCRPAAGGRRAPLAPGLLLVVDQLEQLCTQCEAPEQQRALALVLGSCSEAGPTVRALITVRDDFLAQLGAMEGLAPLLEAMHLVRPLDGEGLRSAVVEPARAFGFSFHSRAMVEQIVSQVAGRAGAMPLLGFALQRLWRERDSERRLIPARALERLGGIGKALAESAEHTADRLRREQLLASARRVLLRLVTPEETQRTCTLGELLQTGDGAARVVQRLREDRLLSGGDDALELAHEALIRHWRTLRAWLDESRAQRQLAADAEWAARRWREAGDATDLLWSGRLLERATSLLAEPPPGDELTQQAVAFLRAAQGQVRRRRRARLALASAGLLALVLTGLLYLRGVTVERDLARGRAVAERRAAKAQRARAEAERRRAEAEQQRVHAVEERQRLLQAWIRQRRQLWRDLQRAEAAGLREHILARLRQEGPPGEPSLESEPAASRPAAGLAGVELCLFGPAQNLLMAGPWRGKTAAEAHRLRAAGYRIGCRYPYVRRAFPRAAHRGLLQYDGRIAPARLQQLRALLSKRYPRLELRRVPSRRLFRTVDLLLPD